MPSKRFNFVKGEKKILFQKTNMENVRQNEHCHHNGNVSIYVIEQHEC